MVRLLTDGFESGSLYNFDLPSTGATINTSSPRSGDCYAGCGSGQYLQHTLPASCQEVYVRAAMSFQAATRTGASYGYFSFGSGTSDYLMVQGSAGRLLSAYYTSANLLATAASPAIVVGEGNWYVIEVWAKRGAVSGRIVVKVDGVTVIDFTGNTGTADFAHFRFHGQASDSIWIDDVAINDTTGGVDDSWPGDGRIIALRPNADSSVQWDGSDGNQVNNYALVDDPSTHDSDSTYVTTTVADEVDLYDVEASGLSGKTISRVWAEGIAKATLGDGSGKFRLGIKTGGTEYWDDADQQLFSTYYPYRTEEHTVNPSDSNPWDSTDLDAIQVGIKSR